MKKSYKLIVLVGLVLGAFFVGLKMLNVYKRGKETMSFTRSKKHFNVATDHIKKVTLENGMTVLVYPNPTIPKVLVQIAYDVGAYVEGPGERGLAHLIEHMIFKGTKKLSETDLDVIARRYGASYNAFTSTDVTSYYFETNKNNWRPFMGILADCMQNARFEEQHLASELKAVIQELKMYKDDYWSMMFEKIDSLMYPANHPYHYPVIGYKEDLMNLSAENLKRFYEKYYHPSRATLFVIGDVDVDEILKSARENFEPIVGKTDFPEIHFPQVQQNFSTQHTRFYEDIKTEQLGFYWMIPGKKDKNEYLSSAAAFLLGSGEGSRLHRRLVDEEKVATSVATFAHKGMESGAFFVLVEPVSGKSDECERLVREEIVKAIRDGFDDKELEHMTKKQGKSFFEKLQRFSSFTYEWLTSYFATRDEYAVFERVNKFVDLDSQDVQKFLAQYIDPSFINRIEVLPIPESKREASLELKRLSDEMDKQILAKYKRTAPIEPPKFALELPGPDNLDFTFPKPERTVMLPNGLKVLLHKNSYLPLISLNCKFKEAFHFASAKEGILVDLMMDMLMEGSDGYSKKDNVDFFEFHGAGYGFGAGGAKLSMLSMDCRPIFERFLHVLTHPDFKDDGLEKIKQISIDDFIRSKDDPGSVGMRTLKSVIYSNHPFSWNYDEAIELVKNSTVEDLEKIHKELLTPANMVLSVVGDFDLDDMERKINDIFGVWPEGPERKTEYPKSQFTPNQTIDKKMLRDQVVLFFGQPSPVNIYHEDSVPLKILNYISFHSLGSRVYMLRERTGLFYNAFGGWGAGAGIENGFDYVGAILSPDKLEYAETEIKALINKIGTDGVTDSELSQARQLYLKTLIDAISTNASVASVFGMLESFDLGFDYYDNVLKRVQTIPLNELNAIAARYFNAGKMARVRVGRL